MAEQISIEAVMAQYADTSLAFADGEMVRCNSTALSLCSSVLRTAIEVANERGVHAQGGFKFCIPMEGVTNAEWLEVAPLWYPGMPSWPEMASTEQLELVIKVASQFDLPAAMARADSYLAHHINDSHLSTRDVVKWLKVANTFCMPKSQQAIARAAVSKHHQALTDKATLEILSKKTLMQMLIATAEGLIHLSDLREDLRDGDFECGNCMCPNHELSWVCTNCDHKYNVVHMA